MLSLVDPRILFAYAAGALFVISGIAFGVQTVRLSSAKTHLAQERQARAEETAERERVAREATARIAALQAEHAAKQQESADAFAQELLRRDSDAATLRADAERLRKQADAFASPGPLSPNPDPAAAKRFANRAATLGHLFQDADGLAEKLATAAERHASEVRLLKKQIAADRAACRAVGP